MILVLIAALSSPTSLPEVAPTQAGTVVTVRFEFSKDGAPDHCIVLDDGGDAELGAAGCKTIMQRARMKVARDQQGRPVKGSRTIKIRYLIADEDHAPAARPIESGQPASKP